MWGVSAYDRPRRTKKYLVELARWDQFGRHYRAPELNELARYAYVLGYEMTPEEMAHEAGHRAFVGRVFGVQEVRVPGADPDATMPT